MAAKAMSERTMEALERAEQRLNRERMSEAELLARLQRAGMEESDAEDLVFDICRNSKSAEAWPCGEGRGGSERAERGLFRIEMSEVEGVEVTDEDVAAASEACRRQYPAARGLRLRVRDGELGWEPMLPAQGFERIRRITGYLVGTLDRFNNGKRSEEADRVKHAAGCSCCG